MVVNRSLLIFAIVAFLAPAISLATEFVVGDDDGWTTGVNYDDWAKDKQFFIGDDLVFKYPVGFHNVYIVDEEDFKSCIVPSNNSQGLFSGDDTVKLATSGDKWYICGVTGHCDGGQKLKITVIDDTAPASGSAF